MSPEVHDAIDQGNCSLKKGDLDQALACYQKAHHLMLDPASGATVLESSGIAHQIGVVYQMNGDLILAIRFLEESLELVRRPDSGASPNRISKTLHQIAMAHQTEGRLSVALSFYEEALALKQEPNSGATASSVSATLHQIGIVHQLQENVSEALRCLGSALELEREPGSGGTQEGVTAILEGIGSVHLGAGNYQAANDIYGEVLAIMRQPNWFAPRSSIADVLHQMGVAYQLSGRHSEALLRFQEALTIRREPSSGTTLRGTAGTLLQMGIVLQQMGRLPEALELHFEALDLFTKSGSGAIPGDSVKALHQIARTYEQLQQFKEAGGYFRRALSAKMIQLNHVQDEFDRIRIASQSANLYREYGFHLIDRGESFTALCAIESLRDLSWRLVLQDRRTTERTLIGSELRQIESELESCYRPEARNSRSNHRENLLRTLETIALGESVNSKEGQEILDGVPAGHLWLGYLVEDGRTALFYAWREGEAGQCGCIEIPIGAFGGQAPELTKESWRSLFRSDQNAGNGYALEAEIANMLFPEPVRSLIARHEFIHITPDGPMWDYPIDALPLLNTRNVDFTPSLRAWLSAHAEPVNVTGPRHAFGVSMFNERDQRTHWQDFEELSSGAVTKIGPQSRSIYRNIPHAHWEAVESAAVLGATQHLEEQVLFSEFERSLSGAGVVVQCSHSEVDQDNIYQSGLALWPNQPSGQYFYTIRRFIEQRIQMPGAIVIIGSCSNAKGKGAIGSAMLSYATMYLLAGAKCVIGTRWEAYDVPSRLLMREFWESMRRGRCASESLLRAKKSIKNHPDFRNSRFWAQFTVYGDGSACLWKDANSDKIPNILKMGPTPRLPG